MASSSDVGEKHVLTITLITTWLYGPSSSRASFRHFSLGTDEGEPPLNFRPNNTADSKIIVTEGYEAMYHHIVNIREDL